MKRLAHIFILLLFTCLASAQIRFMDNLTRVVAGQGKVSVSQDERLTQIINGEKPKEVDNDKDKEKDKDKEVDKEKEEENIDNPALVTPVGKKTKVRGYRVQIYWGGSTRSDQSRAQQAANQSMSLFPQYNAYTSFESPHWRCRVGDFKERHEAVEALRELKKAGIAREAMIVRSEIFIYQ